MEISFAWFVTKRSEVSMIYRKNFYCGNDNILAIVVFYWICFTNGCFLRIYSVIYSVCVAWICRVLCYYIIKNNIIVVICYN